MSIQNATVLWKMAAIAGGALSISGTATIDQVGDGSGTAGLMGQVHYAWGTADLSTAGLYLGEWEVNYASGAKQTFPNQGYVTVAINPDLPV